MVYPMAPLQEVAHPALRIPPRVIEETAGNYSRTARILGIDRTTLYNKVKRYGLR